MSFLEIEEFDRITNDLSERELGPYVINGKVEAYSTKYTTCKPADLVGSSGAPIIPLYPSMKAPNTMSKMPISPYFRTGHIEEFKNPIMEKRSRSSSLCHLPPRKVQKKRSISLGDLSEPSSQKLLFHLITSLNESFPDFDFANTKADRFQSKNLQEVMSGVNNYLAEKTSTDRLFLAKLWTAIDNVVNLRTAEIFSFAPDMDDESFYANIWAFNFFFYNADSLKLVYFRCSARSKLRRHISDALSSINNGGEEDDDENAYDSYDDAGDDLLYRPMSEAQNLGSNNMSIRKNGNSSYSNYISGTNNSTSLAENDNINSDSNKCSSTIIPGYESSSGVNDSLYILSTDGAGGASSCGTNSNSNAKLGDIAEDRREEEGDEEEEEGDEEDMEDSFHARKRIDMLAGGDLAIDEDNDDEENEPPEWVGII